MTRAALRIGVIFPSKAPLAPNQWSGTPFGLKQGFEAVGAEVVPIGHFFPPGLRQIEAALARLESPRPAVADRARTRVRARRWTFQRQLDRAGRLDLVVAMVTEGYHLQHLHFRCPVVTYDDGTYQQIWRNPDSDVANGGYPESAVRRWIATQRESSRAADIACVSTSWAKRSFVEDYRLPAERVVVVGMGHRPRKGQGGARDWSKPTFLFVGVDWRRKNGQRVVDAFRQLHEEYPTTVLHLVGLHTPVEVPGVIDHGMLHKNDSDAQALLDRLYSESTAFVLPSLFDPSPIAYLEAASAGLPVIATSQGGAASLLAGSATIVDPTDEVGLLAAMRDLVDPTRAQQMGTAAAAAAADSSWQAVARRILAAAGCNQEGESH